MTGIKDIAVVGIILLVVLAVLMALVTPLFSAGIAKLAEIAENALSVSEEPSQGADISLAVDWTSVTESPLLNVSNGSSGSQGLKEDLTPLLPDPSSFLPCKQLEDIMKEGKCEFKGEVNPDNSFQVEIKIGEQELGSGYGQQVNLAEFPEFAEAVAQGHTTAWSFYVKVASGLTRLGIGKYIVENMDKIAYQISKSRNLSYTRILIDMSAVKWGPSLVSGKEIIWQQPENGMWIYILTP